LLLAAGAFLWTEYFSEGWSWLRLLGTTSLTVYWVHVELLYGRWFSSYKQTLTIWECLVACSVLAVAMVGMSAAIRTLRQRWTGDVTQTKRLAA